MPQRFSRLLTLRTYGGTLCAPAAALWMAFAGIGIALMAAAEASAWAYVGYFLGTDRQRYVAAAAMGGVAFVAVWIVDATFLTLDLRRGEYERRLERLSQTTPAPPHGWWQSLQHAGRSPLGGVLVRLAMVAGSLTIAAPYVSQLFFYRDVASALTRRDVAVIQTQRDSIVASHDARINTLNQQQDGLRKQLVDESAGRGPSGRFGRGPTVRTIEDRLSELARQLDVERGAKEAELRTFDSLGPEQLSRAYGITTGRDGIQARNEAMATIKTQPGYTRTEWTIRGFLIGLFLMLVVLKLYQPHAAKIYYSEFCQDTYTRYRSGQFDGRLTQQEKVSNAGDMTPLRFDEWLYTDYTDYERETRGATMLGNILSRQKLEVDAIKGVASGAESDMAPLLQDLDQAQSEVESIGEEVMNAESEITAIAEHVTRHQEAIVALERALAYPRVVGGAEHFVTALDTREAWRTGLADLEKQRGGADLRLQKAKARLAANREELGRIQAAIQSKASVLASAEERLNNARNRALNDIDSHPI